MGCCAEGHELADFWWVDRHLLICRFASANDCQMQLQVVRELKDVIG